MKKIFCVLLSLVLMILMVCSFTGCSENNETQEIKSAYDVPFTYDDGFVAKLKVPENTIYTGSAGELCMNFETTLSKTEIEDFYNDYFSTLQAVYSNGHASNEYDYYYDSEQRIILSHLTISDELNENNRTEYFICVDSGNDVENGDFLIKE